MKFVYIEKTYALDLYKEEVKIRGFSRVPLLENPSYKEEKYFLGIPLEIHGRNFVIPISSNKINSSNATLISDGEKIIGSLRYIYMLPVPLSKQTDLLIGDLNTKHQSLVNKKYFFCKSHEDEITRKAKKVYKDVVKNNVFYQKSLTNKKIKFDRNLIKNSVDFSICEKYYDTIK